MASIVGAMRGQSTILQLGGRLLFENARGDKFDEGAATHLGEGVHRTGKYVVMYQACPSLSRLTYCRNHPNL